MRTPRAQSDSTDGKHLLWLWVDSPITLALLEASDMHSEQKLLLDSQDMGLQFSSCFSLRPEDDPMPFDFG